MIKKLVLGLVVVTTPLLSDTQDNHLVAVQGYLYLKLVRIPCELDYEDNAEFYKGKKEAYLEVIEIIDWLKTNPN